MEASTDLAKYACDKCRARKAKCSRQISGCEKCIAEAQPCTYSRSGVIRRNRKSKSRALNSPITPFSIQPSSPVGSAGLKNGSNTNTTSGHDDVITVSNTHDRLRKLAGRDSHALKALAPLFDKFFATWQDVSAFEKLAESAKDEFYWFDEAKTKEWVDSLVDLTQRESLLLKSVPEELLSSTTTLQGRGPRQTQYRAWLIMLYTVALGTQPVASIEAKLRSNLWLAFNDARILLEPQISSMQALIILATHLEEYITPSMYWTLVNKACTMLQALGVVDRRLDKTVCEQRVMVFWRLNVLDKQSSLMMFRPPAFSHEVVSGIPMPTLEQLLASTSMDKSGEPRLFRAQFLHQMHLLSRVMADVWCRIHDQAVKEKTDDDCSVEKLKEEVDEWHRQAEEILATTLTAERPFLNSSHVASLDLGLLNVHFQHNYLLILLSRSSSLKPNSSSYPLQQRANPAAQALLHSLEHMVSPGQYNCSLWQLLHCSFLAFHTLFGGILVRGDNNNTRKRESLAAMERLPDFLNSIKTRHSMIPKVETLAKEMVGHARNIVKSSSSSSSTLREEGGYDDGGRVMGLPTPAPSSAFSDEELDAFLTGTYDWGGFFGESAFDWSSWGSELEGIPWAGGMDDGEGVVR